MIAPLRPSEPETTLRRRRLSHAHHLVATTLLPERSTSSPPTPRIAPWKAWLFAAWLLVAVAAYVWSMV